MKQDTDIRTYFHEFANHTGLACGITRASNGLMRGGILTMNQLCDKPPADLIRIRNLGEKSVALILRVRERYMKERL